MEKRLVPWTIEIKDLATQLRVGLLDQERDVQPIRVNLSIRALTPAFPQSIEDCLNYQPICRWIVEEWPKQPHTPLLETKMLELMRFIFRFDARVESIDAAIFKRSAFPSVPDMEICRTESRAEYDASVTNTQYPAATYACAA